MIAAIIAAMLVLPANVYAFQRWDSVDLDTGTALANLEAAHYAADVTGEDPYLLLFIAWHESHFDADTRTPEAGGRVSCGVMTPTPRTRCRRESLREQYLAGAQHLAEWRGACGRNDRCVLLGYAGGNRLIHACRGGRRMWRRRGRRRVDLCATWELYRDGANEIRTVVEAPSE